MKSLSQKVMANFITRMINMNISRGFYVWLDEVKAHNRRKRSLTSVINHLSRLSIDLAFQKWANKSYQLKHAALAKDLAAKEAEKRRLNSDIKKQGHDNAAEIQNLNDNLNQAIAKKESL